VQNGNDYKDVKQKWKKMMMTWAMTFYKLVTRNFVAHLLGNAGH
jgi:hypothetical protein